MCVYAHTCKHTHTHTHRCLALRVPDPPTAAPPAIVNISKDGRIAAVGGKDVGLSLWSTETGELLGTLNGHETSWTSSNNGQFMVTTQDNSKVCACLFLIGVRVRRLLPESGFSVDA